MIFFYVDEGGDPHPHREPLVQGGTPLFCLSAVAVHASRWRELDRALFQLKRTYFSREMQAFTARNPDMRPEHYEVKGRQLVKPSHAHSRRSRVFTWKILDLAGQLDVRLFAAVWRKEPANPVNAMSMYTQGLQVLAERFHYHCVQAGERGVIVVDRRTRNLDFQVAASHLSYIFGNPVGRAYTTLVEAPMFVDSVLSAGIQLADLVGSCIYGCYYHRRCATLPGVFVGNQLVTQDQFDANPAGPWTSRTPAHDYSHCHQFWPKLTALQFSEDRRSPSWTGRDGVWLLGLPRVDVTSGRRVISERSGGTPTAARPRAPRQAPGAALVTSLGTVAPAEEPGGGAPRDPDSSFSVLPSGLG